jgi:hypothetical protein
MKKAGDFLPFSFPPGLRNNPCAMSTVTDGLALKPLTGRTRLIF